MVSLVLILSNAQTNECLYSDEGDQKYSLRMLGDPLTYSQAIDDKEITFNFDLCDESLRWNDNGPILNAIQKIKSDSLETEQCIPIGSMSSQTFTPVNGGYKLSYKIPDSCEHKGMTYDRVTNIIFEWDQEVWQNQFYKATEENGGCMNIFKLVSPYAWDLNYDNVIYNIDSQTSYKSLILFTLVMMPLLVFVVYLAIGTYVNLKKGNVSGLDAIPHSNLIYEVRYYTSKGCKKLSLLKNAYFKRRYLNGDGGHRYYSECEL